MGQIRTRNAIIVILIILNFVSYGFGYTAGFSSCISFGVKFLESHGAKIDIDIQQIADAVFRYKNHIS